MKNVWLSSAACFLAAALATTTPGTMSAQSGGGTIEGHVKLTGTPRGNAPIPMGADPTCLKINAGKRVVQETVLKATDGGLGNVFAHVQGASPQSSAPSTSVVIDQQGCIYHPRIQGARVGQTLEVKNSDQTLHNVHSMTTKDNAFNIGQPRAGMVFKFPLKAEEVMLRIKCDVHPWMVGYVGVTKEAHDDAKVRMTMAGAKPLNWMALSGEWAPYWASPERALISAIDSQRAGTSSSVVYDWIVAQIKAGVVKQPDFLSAPVPAGSR